MYIQNPLLWETLVNTMLKEKPGPFNVDFEIKTANVSRSYVIDRFFC